MMLRFAARIQLIAFSPRAILANISLQLTMQLWMNYPIEILANQGSDKYNSFFSAYFAVNMRFILRIWQKLFWSIVRVYKTGLERKGYGIKPDMTIRLVSVNIVVPEILFELP